MFSIDRLVPGFDRALAAIPGGVEMARVLGDSADDGVLPSRTAALIRVAVAQPGDAVVDAYAVRMAARQSVRSEDIFFATMGTARDPVEAVIMKAVTQMATTGRRTSPTDFDALARTLGSPKATEVVAQVALAMLACEALSAIAPSTASEPSRRGAQQ